MARIRFDKDFDWPSSGQWHIAYKAGMELTVKRECCDAAVAAGAGVELTSPTNEESANGVDDASGG